MEKIRAMRGKGPKKEKRLTQRIAIRNKCLHCCCDDTIQVKYCGIIQCPVWIFRLGVNPYNKKHEKNPLFSEEIFRETVDYSLVDVRSYVDKKIDEWKEINKEKINIE